MTLLDRMPKEILSGAALKRCCHGDLILREGQPGGHVYFLVSGACKIYTSGVDGHRLIQNIIDAPDAFGMIELFKGLNNASSVEAFGDVELVVIDRVSFLKWLHLDQEFCMEMLSKLADIAYMQIEKQSINILYPLKYRFLSYLLECHHKNPHKKIRFDKRILSEQLATTVRHLNRIINECVQMGFLTYEDGVVHVLDWQALKGYKG